MNAVQIDQKSFQMPPKEGIRIAHFLTVADVERSARYYEKVFGAHILTMGDGNAPPYLQLANIWIILNVGGGPTPDKPTVTLSVPDPNQINSFMNFRVADIQACYEFVGFNRLIEELKITLAFRGKTVSSNKQKSPPKRRPRRILLMSSQPKCHSTCSIAAPSRYTRPSQRLRPLWQRRRSVIGR
jgi:hypothetical protein